MRPSFTPLILFVLSPLAQIAAQGRPSLERGPGACCRPEQRALHLPSTPLAPLLAHHEGRTFLATGGTVGGALGLSALVNIRPGDSPWAVAGTLTFTPTGAALGSVVGAVATGGLSTIGVAVPGLGMGLLAGAAGHSVGQRAAAGSRGSRVAIHLMGVLAIPAVILVGWVYWAVRYES